MQMVRYGKSIVKNELALSIKYFVSSIKQKARSPSLFLLFSLPCPDVSPIFIVRQMEKCRTIKNYLPKRRVRRSNSARAMSKSCSVKSGQSFGEKYNSE